MISARLHDLLWQMFDFGKADQREQAQELIKQLQNPPEVDPDDGFVMFVEREGPQDPKLLIGAAEYGALIDELEILRKK